jgi:hypothetical protein
MRSNQQIDHADFFSTNECGETTRESKEPEESENR